MATIITTLPDIAFPYELNLLKIAADSKVEVKITYAGHILMDTVLYPIDGVIELYDMAVHIIDFLKNEIAILTIALDGKEAKRLQILPNNMGVDCTAEECYTDTFMTRATVKYTHAEAKELLHFVCNSETFGIVTAVAQKDGAVVKSQQELPLSLEGDIATLDVSPSVLFSLDGYELTEYTVAVGKRTMKFRMMPDGMVDKLHEFGFINSFLQEEYIALMGDAERDVKVERRESYIRGQLRNFHVEAFPHWTIRTLIPDGMAGVFDDLVAAKELWRKEDGCILAITESEDKTSSSSSAMNIGSLTLREAGRIYTHHPARPIKTFDHTFDDTFL